jgi:ribosome modulation factor
MKKTPLDIAYNKGAKAYADGKDLSDCPYQDKRNDSGKLTWSRAFIRAWQLGYLEAANKKTGD